MLRSFSHAGTSFLTRLLQNLNCCMQPHSCIKRTSPHSAPRLMPHTTFSIAVGCSTHRLMLARTLPLRSFWWDIASLIQRTVLTGWFLLIDLEQQFIRLLAALVVSLFFLCAAVDSSPGPFATVLRAHIPEYSLGAGSRSSLATHTKENSTTRWRLLGSVSRGSRPIS